MEGLELEKIVKHVKFGKRKNLLSKSKKSKSKSEVSSLSIPKSLSMLIQNSIL